MTLTNHFKEFWFLVPPGVFVRQSKALVGGVIVVALGCLSKAEGRF